MPRGLGDNPLKREKKLRHTRSRASRSASSSLGTESASPLPSGPGDVHTSSGVGSSYNDVFFQRHPDTPVSPVVSVNEETHVETSVVTTSEPVVEVVPATLSVQALPIEAPRWVETTRPAEAATRPVEVTPLAEEATPVEEAHAEPVPSVVEQHLEGVPSGPAEVPAVAIAAEPPAPATPAAETADQSPDKKGFFGRIFGKWRKS